MCLCGSVRAVCFVSSVITDLHFIMQRQKLRLMYNVPLQAHLVKEKCGGSDLYYQNILKKETEQVFRT